jgi:hypothetical protein
MNRPVDLIVSVIFLAACAHGGRPGAPPSPVAGQAADSGKGHAADTSKIKPYTKVIPASAITHSGLLITHQVDDKLYFELPRPAIGVDFLMVGRLARAAAGDPGRFNDYGGDEFTENVLRWEQHGRTIVLRHVIFESVADSTLPIAQAVKDANYPEVVAVFPIETFGKDSAPVINVTSLYTTLVPEFAAWNGGVDEKRSYIERAAAYPENVEVEATQTGTPQNEPGEPPPPGPKVASSVLAHWSMVHLPENPMQARRCDDRVGFFTATDIDFGTAEQRAARRCYITRWRLEKKDPSAAVSDPVNPLVYYIDPATPKYLVPWIKKGVESWQPAFEAAGFSNAIVAREVPTDDSTWSMEDVRHTMVRWLATTVENSVGPNIHDPRTGQILNGSVRMFHNIMNLQRDWYFTQVAPLDPRAQHLPFPDSLMGRLVMAIVSHEVGHTIGLRHNMQASSEYPADSVRSATWVHRMGHCASVMDYCRFNYVAQPEDKIALEDLVPRVGPYDIFAIHWGYAPIPNMTTSSERPTLDQWATAQDTVPWFRYEGDEQLGGPDPGVENEAVGDADAVKSTTAGLKNIKRIMMFLVSATLKPVEDNSDLSELYDRLLGQWSDEVNHVVKVVGGEWMREKSGSQPGPRYTPVSAERQRAAVAFVAANVFATPRYLLDTAVLRRIEPQGALERLQGVQARALGNLLSDDRLSRMTDIVALSSRPADTYTPLLLFVDVRHAIWNELAGGSVEIDPFRRNLQRVYITVLAAKVAPPPAQAQMGRPPPRGGAAGTFGSDISAIVRGELVALDADVAAAIARSGSRETRVHLADIRARIDRALHPERPVASGGESH